MTLWTTMAVFPNLEIAEPIDAGRGSFVRVDDHRIFEINSTHPNQQTFLSRFTDAFRASIRPTILLLRPTAGRSFKSVDSIMSLRDILSASVVPLSRARTIQQDSPRGINFSKAFDPYPWTIDKNFEYLVAINPALMALHKPDTFHGQAAPEITTSYLSKIDLDEPMFSALAIRWKRAYSSRRPQWTDVALMRSLNAAYHASQLPAPLNATILDYGRLIALWVSAFELLVHPGKGGRAGQWKVYDLLASADWKIKENRRRQFNFRDRNGRQIRKSFPELVYKKLYYARNSFIHGNPINQKSLSLPTTKWSLIDFAPLLYRMALSAFLDLRWSDSMPSSENAIAFARAFSKRRELDDRQRKIETAIAMAHGYQPPNSYSTRRRSRSNAAS